MRKNIIALRQKLPTRGYVKLILEAEREAIGPRKKMRITEDEVKNLFSSRSVDPDKKLIIIENARTVVKKIKEHNQRVNSMAAAV